MKARILVVDDDEAVLDYLHSMIGDRYELISTNAPDNVLELARKHRPNLILCDIDMPEMDGGDVSAALFADSTLRSIPVLFLSALVDEQGQLAGRHAIPKNAPLDALVKKIESLLR